MASSDYQRYVANEQRQRRMKRYIIEILVVAFMFIPAIIVPIHLRKFLIINKVKLQPDSDGYQTWLDPPIHTVRSYYLFNITNPNDIVTDPEDTTILVQDTPPYTYNVKTIKKNSQWSKNNKRLDYEVEREFTRDPDRFNSSSLEDTGVFVDLLRAIFRTQFQAKPAETFFTLAGMNTFYHRNAIEQLEGFTSDLFNLVRDKMMGPNTDKSGFVYRQNGSRLYSVSIETDPMKKGQVITFSNDLTPFNISSPSQYSFPIYDSLTYPPMLFDKPALNIFNSDFCTPILLQFNQATIKHGIDVHEYRIKFINLKNCTDPTDSTTCTEIEKLDISKCISDSLPENTIFLSKAHFYGSTNESLADMNIKGFNSTRDQHDSVVYFEPYSGTPLEASFRMQINIDATIDPMRRAEYGSDPEPTKRKGVKRLVPIFWIDQDIKLLPAKVNEIRRSLDKLKRIPVYFIGLAIVLAIVFIIIMECLARRADQKRRGTYVKTETHVHH